MTLSIIHHEHDCVVSEDPYSHYKWAMQFVFVWFADTEVQCMCGFCEHVANSRYVCIYIKRLAGDHPNQSVPSNFQLQLQALP